MTSLEWYKAIMPEIFGEESDKETAKDKLRQEAEEWTERNKPVQDDWEDSDIIQAIIDTNEKRDKHIAELEQQLKKKVFIISQLETQLEMVESENKR